MKKYLLLITLLVIHNFIISQIHFEELEIQNVSQATNSLSGIKKVFFMDASNNNYSDILINTENTTVFFRNDTNNNFTQDTNLIIESSITEFIDYDFDNDLDIVSYADGFEVFVHINDGNGNFTNEISIPSLCDFKCLDSFDFVDLTNDMHMDFVSSAYVEFIEQQFPEEQLLINNGDNTFTISNNLVTSFQSGSSGIQFVDFDNDNDFDIYTKGDIVSGIGGFETIDGFFVNDGDGVFSTFKEVDHPGPSFKFIDFNNDGILDFYGGTSILINNGFGEFISVFDFDTFNTNSNNNRLRYINFGNIDNDAFPDVIITKGMKTGCCSWSDLTSELYINDGNGNFILFSDVPFQDIVVSSADFADIDLDGKNEIIIHGEDEFNNSVTKIYTVTSSLSIDEYSIKKEIKIIPNPTTDSFKLSEILNLKSLKIYSIDGQLLIELTKRKTLNSNTFDISNLPNGTYIIEVKTINSISHKKLIKQ